MFKCNLGSKTGLKFKNNRGVLSSRLRKKVVPNMEKLHVPLLVRNIMVSIYWVPGVALDVENMDTKLENVLTLILEEKRVTKLILVFQRKILQQGGVSMHSLLEERSRIRVMMMLVIPSLISLIGIWVFSKRGSMAR